jgi:exopolysaccharide production protein ExoQ
LGTPMVRSNAHCLNRKLEVGRAESSVSLIDKYSFIPILACLYTVILHPLIMLPCSLGDWNHADTKCLMESGTDAKFFWPTISLFSVALILWHRSRLALPPHVICLLPYLAFAGASVLWAFKPELSFIRYAQQVMIVISIVLPAIMSDRRVDLIRALFLCFAFAAILNMIFAFIMPPLKGENVTLGYTGYFPGKNYLGELAAIVLLLSLSELTHSWCRRVVAIIFLAVAFYLLFLSNSKTALGLALLAPLVAGLTLIIRRITRISPAVIPVAVLFVYMVLSSISNFTVYRLSYMIYGESTFTHRKIIWDFASNEIARRPLLGWGYQSFWLVGPDGPSIVDAPGWVKDMPNAHNGYLDTRLELGYVGFGFLLTFILATLHAIGRLLDLNPSRGWSVLSLFYFVMIHNFLESTWMRGFEFLWIVFLFLVAEIARSRPPLRRSQDWRRVSPEPRQRRALAAIGRKAIVHSR